MNIFWRKFSRYLLIGLSFMVLLAGSQQMVAGNVLQRGPGDVLAEEDNCLDPEAPGCAEPGGGGQVPEAPAPEAPPVSEPEPGGGGQVPEAPAPEAPAPQCTEVRQYNECTACNTSRRISEDSCGGFTTLVGSQSDPGCASWCPAEPAVSCPDDLRYCDTNINRIVHKFGGVPDSSQPGGCRYAFEQEGTCNIPPSTAQAPACDPGQLNMSVSPNPSNIGNSVNFALSGSQGSTWFGDSWSGGVDCSGAFWGSKTCTALASGNFSWTHTWQNTAPNNFDIKSALCSKTVNFTVQTPACVSNGSCSAPTPACNTTTSGVDNCGNACNKVGPACPVASPPPASPPPASPPPACVPNGTCSAPAPACGTITSGTDNCGNPCNKQGPACPVPVAVVCQPASQTVQVNQVASLVSNNTGRAITWSAPNGNPSSGTGTNFSTRFAQTGTFNVTVSDGLTSSICRVTAQLAPAPTPSPIPTPIPTPPAAQNITLSCPDGSTVVVAAGQNANMNTLCQSQQQQQNQIALANAQGGTATITFGNVGVAPQPVVIQPAVVKPVAAVQPVVVPQVAGVAVTALPKTGLPLLAWSLLAFIPTGFGLRKFKQLKREREDDPSYIWEDRKFRSGF